MQVKHSKTKKKPFGNIQVLGIMEYLGKKQQNNYNKKLRKFLN